MNFNLIAKVKDSKARAGAFETDHGIIETPRFMPVGTQGTVKAVSQRILMDEIKAPIILGNTYHLYLRPGMEIIESAGGLHKFMNWDRAIFTDSGGFQMIRPDFHAQVDDRGITFRSPFDGVKHLFTPEKCIETQVDLGIDIAMMLDHCPEFSSSIEYVKTATENTTAWAKMSLEKLNDLNQKYQKNFNREIKVGIGINAGEVVAGNLGSEDRIDYSMTGDTVNTGKRIETITKEIPNSVLISHSVYEKVKDSLIHTRMSETYQKQNTTYG